VLRLFSFFNKIFTYKKKACYLTKESKLVHSVIVPLSTIPIPFT